jgi:hypothetical protein
MKTGRQSGNERRNSVVVHRTAPSDMQLVTSFEKAIQLLGKLIQAQRYSVLSGSFKGFSCNGIALDLQEFGIE